MALAGYAQANRREIARIPEGEDGKYKLRLFIVVESTWREAKEIATFGYDARSSTREQGREVAPASIPQT